MGNRAENVILDFLSLLMLLQKLACLKSALIAFQMFALVEWGFQLVFAAMCFLGFGLIVRDLAEVLVGPEQVDRTWKAWFEPRILDTLVEVGGIWFFVIR